MLIPVAAPYRIAWKKSREHFLEKTLAQSQETSTVITVGFLDLVLENLS